MVFAEIEKQIKIWLPDSKPFFETFRGEPYVFFNFTTSAVVKSDLAKNLLVAFESLRDLIDIQIERLKEIP